MDISKSKLINAYITFLFFLFPVYLYSQHMEPILYNYINYDGQPTFYEIYYFDVDMVVYVITAFILGLVLKKLNFHFFKLMTLFNVYFCFKYWLLLKGDVLTFLLAVLVCSLLFIPLSILYLILKKCYRLCYDWYLIIKTKSRKEILNELKSDPFFQALAFTITVFTLFFLLVFDVIKTYLASFN